MGDFNFNNGWTLASIHDVLTAYYNGPSQDLLPRPHLYIVYCMAGAVIMGFIGSGPL